MRYDGRDESERVKGMPSVPTCSVDGSKRDEAALARGGAAGVESLPDGRSMLLSLRSKAVWTDERVRERECQEGSGRTERCCSCWSCRAKSPCCPASRAASSAWASRRGRRPGGACLRASTPSGVPWLRRRISVLMRNKSRRTESGGQKRTESEDLEPRAPQPVRPLPPTRLLTDRVALAVGSRGKEHGTGLAL